MNAERFGALAGRVMARLAKQVEVSIAPLDLSLSQYRVLGFLADGSAASSALAERMAVTAPSVTSVVDGLVARELVERRPDPLDRRRLPLTITEAGAAVLRQANVAVGERLGHILVHLGDSEAKADIEAGLVAWQTALDGHRSARHEEKAALRP